MDWILHTPTNKLQQSVDFYSRLNFKLISEINPVLFTDGKVKIEINPDRYARPGIKIFKPSWQEEINLLEERTTVHKTTGGFLVNDLCGTWIYLTEGTPDDKMRPETGGTSFGLTGHFAGLSIEAADLPKSSSIWKAVGFAGDTETAGQGWVSLSNESGLTVNLMKPLSCPHLFFNPSLTFFNGKNNPSVIQKIRGAGIPVAEEITHFNPEGKVDNIIIRDPGGYGFFIFND